jgi:hypothetical protein
MKVFRSIEEDDGHEFVLFSGWLKLSPHSRKPSPSLSMMDYEEEQAEVQAHTLPVHQPPQVSQHTSP